MTGFSDAHILMMLHWVGSFGIVFSICWMKAPMKERIELAEG